MLTSSFLPLFLLLIVPSLFAGPGPGSVPAPSATLPDFDPTKCDDAASVFCYIQSSSGIKFIPYKSDMAWPATKPDFQFMLRSFNPNKMIVDIWAKGSSAMLKDNANLVIFGCSKEADGSVLATSDRPITEVVDIASAVSSEDFHCRFSITSRQKVIFKYPDQREMNLAMKFVTDKDYMSTRASFAFPEGCDRERIKNDGSLDRKGYVVIGIPNENLFATSVECPDGSTLIYESQSRPKEASSISCKEDTVAGNFYYSIVNADDSETKKTGDFKAGCQRRECEQCSSDPQFPAEVKKISVDDCPVYQCPHSLMLINDVVGPTRGDVTCAKIKDQEEYDWSIGGEKVAKAACPTSLPCHVVSNLTCLKDPKCEMLVSREVTSLLCKDGKKLQVVHAGSATAVTTLACGLDGRFKMTTAKDQETDLPDGAEVNCVDDAPKEPAAAPQKGGDSMGLYIGCGLAVAAAIGALVAIALCCAKRAKKKGGKSQLPQTTTTKAETTKTTRSAETKSASAGTPTPLPPPPPPPPAQSVPIHPPTPIAVTTPYASSPWPLDMTEMTPNAPTPLEQSAQQEAPNSKSKSAPIIPLPKIDPPPSDGEQSKSGVESTKKRGQQDSDVESKASKKGSERVRPTQQEESTKRTQNEPSRESTKRTQQTQMTRSVNEGGGRTPRAATRMPPKKAEYVAMNEVNDEEFDSEEDKTKKRKQTGPLTQLTQPSSDLKASPYLVLGDFDTPPKETTDYKNLITQKSEEDKSKK